ncbi:hypothetical protein J4204_00945 [Candidatus Woesearchaeota archaeon]|nr:hypothetical protein [Candidatus Woesearchaeota archaeon]
MDEETHKLGGNIELAGFRDVDSSSMIVLKKVIGNHARRLSELAKKMETLHITLKPIHEREKSEKYEVHAKLNDNGKVYAAEAVDRNLFVAVNDVLKRIQSEME